MFLFSSASLLLGAKVSTPLTSKSLATKIATREYKALLMAFAIKDVNLRMNHGTDDVMPC